MILSALLSLTALAGDLVVLHPGDTVESLAGNDPDIAARIRALNGLEAEEQPRVGALVELPVHLSGLPAEAAVVNVHRGASASLPGAVQVELIPGTGLPPGSRVCTSEKGYVTLRLAAAQDSRQHDDITLLPNTCLTIQVSSSQLSGRSSVVRLESGSVTVPRPEAGATPGKITVSTEAGVTTTDRGGFRVHVESESSRTEALYDSLSVFGEGVERRVEAGQGVRVRAGEAPSSPIELPKAARLTSPDNNATLRRPDFSWVRLDTALGYQLELAGSEDFREMLVARAVDRPAWEPARLLLPGEVDGIWWRVSAIDRHGFIGAPSESRVLLLPAGVAP